MKIKNPTPDEILYDGGDWEITRREVLFSIIIVIVMVCIGSLIGSVVDNNANEAKQKYQHVLVIDNDDALFQYGIRTDVGDVLCHSTLSAVDPVSLGSESNRMYIREVLERYTMHTGTYTTTDGKGHTTTHTYTYWTWDHVSEKSSHSNQMIFAGVTMAYGKIAMPGAHYTKIVRCGYHLRHVYYVIDKINSGVLYTHLDNNGYTHGKWYNLSSAASTKESLMEGTQRWIVIFWVIWVIAILVLTGVFYWLPNDWLTIDKREIDISKTNHNDKNKYHQY